MILLVVGLTLFLGVHLSAVLVPGWRAARIAAWGAGQWKMLYSLISLAGLVCIVIGYSQTRYSPIVIYSSPVWLRSMSLLFMLPVFPLLIAAYIPGKIRAALKHPMLIAVRTWAFAHLLANGMLADVLLFGSLLLWSVVVQVSLKGRPAIAAPSLPGRLNDAAAIIIGVVVFLAFVLVLHRVMFGVSPLV